MLIRLLVALSFCLAACEPSDMALPTSREETATPANPVRSNTINAIQDAIIGAKQASMTLWIFPAGPVLYAGGGTPAASAAGGYVNIPSGTSVLGSLGPLLEGTRITGGKVVCKGPGGNSGLYNHVGIYVAQSGTGTYLTGADILDDTDATWRTITMTDDVTMPHTLAAAESFYYTIDPETADFRVAAIGLIVDRL